MKTLERQQANSLFNKFWNEMKEHWFKLEVLQDYGGEDDSPSLKAWLDGDRAESIRLMRLESNINRGEAMRKKAGAGIRLQRVHVVDRPLTGYLEWELEHYKNVNVPLWGEDIYLVDRLDLVGLVLPAGDMMIFDGKRVVVNTYDKNATMTHQTFYNENDNIQNFLELSRKISSKAESI